jgi:hypothetical protein
MKRTTMVFLFACVLLPVAAAEAQQYCSDPYYIEQAFPVSGPEVSRWKLCWQVVKGANLVITGAWFRPAPASPWIKILYDGRMSQLFVPYHPLGSNRFHDVNYNFPHVPLTANDCPAPATIIGPASEVCKSVRDRGLMWKHYFNQRRGEELSLMSVLGAANYTYLVEWIFRDDGVFGMRLSMTGLIWPDLATHMHGTIWRLDIDLNGACCNTASIMSHKEVGLTGVDSMTDVTTANGFGWDPLAYDMLSIRDATLKNAKGHTTEWHIMPYRTGTPKHDEPFTKFTYWVTPYVWNQTLADDLPTYISGSPSTKNTDIVLWYYTGVHHIIRDEDLAPDGSRGMTLTMVDNFWLKPFNLWATTPFCEPPYKCE